MSTLQTISFFTVAGDLQKLTVNNYSVQNEILFFNKEFDEAIDGSLRQNVRGIRRTFSIFYNKCIEPSTLRGILNNIITDLNVDGNDRESFKFFQGDVIFIDDSTEVFNSSTEIFNEFGIDEINVTLDDETIHTIQYTNQTGRYVPKINMIETTIT
tara:strand:- start:602 stop:1069 length:468 start_codon:yes stop_codon:yes gene_type:complete